MGQLSRSTATGEWCMSAIDLVGAYLRERARPRLFAPLAVLLALAGWALVPGLGFDTSDVALTAAQAFIFMLAFRVWDDLEDSRADRLRHPDRVMVQSRQIEPFAFLIAALAAVGMVS